LVAQSTLRSQSERLGWTLTFPAGLWNRLNGHLFPGDADEHGAVVLAGLARGRNGFRLLAKEVVLAEDGRDYIPGERGYRALTPLFIASVARRARDERLAYLAVHCHGGAGRVDFSEIDLASHERGYPALQQITRQVVGGVVLANGAAAGDLWVDADHRVRLEGTTVLGGNIVTLTPKAPAHSVGHEPLFDRQARIFGEQGQRRLASMKVAVVGLGGAGSMAAEMLARLGVGELLLVDPDRLEPSNLSRVVGSRRADLHPSITADFVPRLLRKLGERRSSLKVQIAAHAIRRAGLPVRTTTMPLDVAHKQATAQLALCDWIVLAADSQHARLVVNAVVHAYLIPAIQIGVKIPVEQTTGAVGDIFAVARRVLPDFGCLWCNGLIDATELQLEVLGDEGRAARAYVGEDAPAPSVITLNGLAAATGMTDLLLASTGLLSGTLSSDGPGYVRIHARTGKQYLDIPRRDRDCPYCGSDNSILGLGDTAALPTARTLQ